MKVLRGWYDRSFLVNEDFRNHLHSQGDVLAHVLVKRCGRLEDDKKFI